MRMHLSSCARSRVQQPLCICVYVSIFYVIIYCVCRVTGTRTGSWWWTVWGDQKATPRVRFFSVEDVMFNTAMYYASVRDIQGHRGERAGGEHAHTRTHKHGGSHRTHKHTQHTHTRARARTHRRVSSATPLLWALQNPWTMKWRSRRKTLPLPPPLPTPPRLSRGAHKKDPSILGQPPHRKHRRSPWPMRNGGAGQRRRSRRHRRSNPSTYRPICAEPKEGGLAAARAHRGTTCAARGVPGGATRHRRAAAAAAAGGAIVDRLCLRPPRPHRSTAGALCMMRPPATGGSSQRRAGASRSRHAGSVRARLTRGAEVGAEVGRPVAESTETSASTRGAQGCRSTHVGGCCACR
jgi:hypothetical protein